MKKSTTIERVTGYRRDGTPYVELHTFTTESIVDPSRSEQYLKEECEQYHEAEVMLARIQFTHLTMWAQARMELSEVDSDLALECWKDLLKSAIK